LTATLAREAEWLCREEHNEVEAEAMRVVYEDGWPGVAEDQCFPPLDRPLHSDGWPDLSPSPSTGVRVTVEVTSTTEDIEGHSACRLPCL
jgi:hypothetical protein